MERWVGKVAVVTGASAGIGAAIVLDLVKSGMTVVGLARRKERVELLKQQIPETASGKLYSMKCDVTNEDDIKSAFEWITQNLGGVDILVNNAGVLKLGYLVDKDNTSMLREIIDTNIMGVVLCTREAFQSMKERKVDGHIVLINSIEGHTVSYFVGKMPAFNMYPSSKYAITAMTEVLRQEFQMFKTNIKISSISPGLVATDIVGEEIKPHLEAIPHLKSEDVSAAVLYVLGTPAHVQVHELIIKPMNEAC